MRTATMMAVACASLMLSGCNSVTSETPIFSPADAGPLIKQGVWANADCTVTEVRPHPSGPACGVWYVVSATNIRPVGSFDAKAHPGQRFAVPESIPYIVVDGRPPVAQLKFGDPKSGDALYVFMAIDPKQRVNGEVTEATVWRVVCGPPATDEDLAARPRNSGQRADWEIPPSTLHPFPGLTPVAFYGCRPADKTAVLNAAGASRDVAQAEKPLRAIDQPLKLHWIRDAPE